MIKSKHNEWSFIEKRYYVTLARYTQKVNDCLYLFMVVDVLLLPSLVLHSLCIYFSSKFHSHSDLRWHINPSQVYENGRNSRGFLLHYYTVHLRGKNIIFHESTLVCVRAKLSGRYIRREHNFKNDLSGSFYYYGWKIEMKIKRGNAPKHTTNTRWHW